MRVGLRRIAIRLPLRLRRIAIRLPFPIRLGLRLRFRF
jgi:hypothetical protein